MGTDLIEVGTYHEEFNDVLGTKNPLLPICASIAGLRAHMIKHRHFDCLQHLEHIEEFIASPDYIGTNPNESGISFECVKVIDKDIQIGIKLEPSGEYYYVASMYSVPASKIQRRLYGGRLKKYP